MNNLKIKKRVLNNLSKCYSIAPLKYQNQDYFLVAAEKQDPCYLFDLNGKLIDKVWDGPGGVMSMVQIPNTNGQFLATHKFYSPNDSKESKIVIVTPISQGKWEVRTLVDLPHVHRFDLLQNGGKTHLIACTLKSGHEYKEDWSMPGKIFATVLPDDLSSYNENHQLDLKVIKESLLRNHGYTRNKKNGVETAIISGEEGVFRCTPPGINYDDWKIEQILDTPTSDAVLVDIDQDGEEELCTLAPFHGENVAIYKKISGIYTKIYDYPEVAEFTHALYGGNLCGQPTFVFGHRQGKRNLVTIRYNQEAKEYYSEILDEGCGPANIFYYKMNEKEVIIAANRETDEIAMYSITI